MNVLVLALAGLAAVSAGIAAGLVVAMRVDYLRRVHRRARGLGAVAEGRGEVASPADGGKVLRYAERLTRQLFTGDIEPLSPSVRAKRAAETRAGSRYQAMAVAAGCSKEITVSAYCEARARLTVAGALAGLATGLLFSTELAVVLCAIFALLGRSMPYRAVRAAVRRRAVEAERHLSEMLDVVALGLRSGLTFDRSFALYGSHFGSDFARSCTKAYRSWSFGLTTREEALRDFASSYECDQLSRSVDSIIRGLQFGSALAGILEEGAAQSRAAYRATVEERVAKAPVKMMLPTGTLILPAMLLLVLGPILLELAGGF